MGWRAANRIDECILIRCIEVGQREQELASFLHSYFNENRVYFVTDRWSREVTELERTNEIAITKEKLQALRLYQGHPRLTWLCGDYALYVATQEVTATHYWIVEPDVHFRFEDACDFFNAFRSETADFIAPHFGPASDDWAWSSMVEHFGLQPYKCLFPLCRFSARATSHLLRHRQRHSDRMEKEGIPFKRWPNDESFCASVVAYENLKPLNPGRRLRNVLRYFNVRFPIPTNQLANIPLGHVVHPVLSRDDCVRKLSGLIKRSVRGTPLNNAGRWINERNLDDDDYRALLAESFLAWLDSLTP